MALENDKAVFSLRLPRSLADQIDARAKLSMRHRNSEIVMLLQQAIDMLVMRDLKLIEEQKQDQA